MNSKVLLMILDGWGIAADKSISAPDQAYTPFIDNCYVKYPNCRLDASGESVGLPHGQMGNSEVGHIHIGSGRVCEQELQRVNNAVKNHTLFKHKEISAGFEQAKQKNKQVHLLGLLSDGGIHSHINHVKELCDIAHKQGIEKLFIHAFTDGRDTDPKSGIGFIQELESHLDKSIGEIASVIGRYYSMDRDHQWNRIKIAYDALVNGKGEYTTDIATCMRSRYNKNETDEFLKPIIQVNKQTNKPLSVIEDDDMVIFFNFRTDRGRQLTHALSQENLISHEMQTLKLDFYTMTNYDESFKNIKVIFNKDDLRNTLGETISRAGKKQIRIAETQKYAHVTYFFSGGREKEFPNEKRIMIKSSDVATYDLKPEMSANEIKEAILPFIVKGDVDFICLNFANLDMVGHTGVFSAAVKACETVDRCAEQVVNEAIANNYTILITADHGNAELMKNKDGSSNTAHTTNPVPLFLIKGPENITMSDGTLTDLAPTILDLLHIDKPTEMTGKVLYRQLK